MWRASCRMRGVATSGVSDVQGQHVHQHGGGVSRVRQRGLRRMLRSSFGADKGSLWAGRPGWGYVGILRAKQSRGADQLEQGDRGRVQVPCRGPGAAGRTGHGALPSRPREDYARRCLLARAEGEAEAGRRGELRQVRCALRCRRQFAGRKRVGLCRGEHLRRDSARYAMDRYEEVVGTPRGTVGGVLRVFRRRSAPFRGRAEKLAGGAPHVLSESRLIAERRGDHRPRQGIGSSTISNGQVTTTDRVWSGWLHCGCSQYLQHGSAGAL